jgi:predicted Na+-dependent transporter
LKKTRQGSVIAILVIEAALYLLFTVVALAVVDAPPVRRSLGCDRGDAVAVAMCGATKTVALGIPLISVIYASSDKAGILAVPLLMYHAFQILAGALLVPRLRAWRARDPKALAAAAARAADAESGGQKAALAAATAEEEEKQQQPGAAEQADGEGAAAAAAAR